MCRRLRNFQLDPAPHDIVRVGTKAVVVQSVRTIALTVLDRNCKVRRLRLSQWRQWTIPAAQKWMGQ